jgi:Domain of unknown function (DUF4129)
MPRFLALPPTAREPSARVPGAAGATIIAGGGLLLTLAALLAASRGVDDAPPVRVTVDVPDALLMAGAIAFVLAAIVVLAIALSRDRVRPPDGELYERYRKLLELPWWLQTLFQLLPVLPLIAVVAILWFGWPLFEETFIAWGRRLLQPPPASETPTPETPIVSLPWLGWLLGLLALVAGLATLAVALVLLFAERLADWWERRTRRLVTEPLRAAVEESLDDLADDADPRTAIIKCYQRFERVASRARVPRAPWQTPEEFMRATLARLALPPDAVERLTRLFELARFSHHPLDAQERDLAREALETIRAFIAERDAAHAVA